VTRSNDARARALRGSMQRLLRRFGALAADATPCGKPLSMAHAHALMVLSGRGGLSQQELGAELGIDKSNVARLCARLVDGGHATQAICGLDARSRRVSLTPSGERLAREVDASSLARFGALLSRLPRERQSAILDALDQLASAVDTLPTQRIELE
jgi:DNA-binding MarR family transcriptional regulator